MKLIKLNAFTLAIVATMVIVTTANKIVKSELVDKEYCLGTSCGSDYTECWKYTWDTGYFFYRCEAAYCKHMKEAKCKPGYRCAEWTWPCNDPSCKPYNCVPINPPPPSDDTQDSGYPDDDDSTNYDLLNNPCFPNPCGFGRSCRPFTQRLCNGNPNCPKYLCY